MQQPLYGVLLVLELMQQAVSEVVRGHRDPIPAIRVTVPPKRLWHDLLPISSRLTVHLILAAEEISQVSTLLFEVQQLRDLVGHVCGLQMAFL